MDFQHLVLKKISQAAQDAAVSKVESRSSQLKFANNKIVKTGSESVFSISVFCSIDKRVFSTTLRENNEKCVGDLVKKLSAASKVMPARADFFGFAPKQGGAYPRLKNCFDKNILPPENKQLDLVESAVNAAIGEKAVRSAGILEFHNSSHRLLTTNGVDAVEDSTNAYFSIRAMAQNDGSGHQVAAGRMLKSLDVEKASRKAGELAFESRNPTRAPSGKMSVILNPLPLSPLLDAAGSSSSSFYMEAGLSFFAGKVGKKVGSPAITIYDDPQFPNGFNSTSFDAEGTRAYKKPIVEKGVFKTVLHNYSTAKKHGLSTTGNAGLIAPNYFNLVLEKGGNSLEKLVSQVDNGLLVTNLWYTRFNNYSSGEFSTMPRDALFLIKNGAIEKPVRGIRISENMLNLMQNARAAGSDSQQVYSWEAPVSIITPSVLFDNVNITKPTG
ncbi:TldD/PmbA family protein [Candidatus Micrarchaeota archaeon]|nr:TldD/PmbA family protein [Candidatus Micrarchaeota archaeon]